MSLKQQIEADLKKAMLAKDKDELRALRGIKSMILLAETEKGAAEGISEDTELKLLTKAAKQRKESADVYIQQGRQDLADIELVEVAVIERYLPKQLSDEELQVKIKAIVEKTGAEGPKDMGKVMGAASKELAGQADGKRISETVKSILST
jgi:uncharacterized protein